MFERWKYLTIKEFIQTFRERRRRNLLILAPLIQIFLFGYVATLDVDNVPTALLDLDKSQESREFARRLEACGYFTITRWPSSAGELGQYLDRGDVLAAIQIDRGFSKDIKKGSPAPLQLLMDGTDSNSAQIAMGHIAEIVRRLSRDLSAQPSLRKGADWSAQPSLRKGADFRTRVWYNPDLRSRNFFLPGVIALIILLTCLMTTSMAIVREREVGTMEQLMVTPIRPAELVLAKMFPSAVIGVGQMALVTAAGVFWFHVPIKGALSFLFVCTGVYLLPVLGIGLFISTISRTQQQAMMASFFFFQPTVLLSGFATPIENMPLAFQYVTYLSPLRYFLVIVRGIFLKGVGLEVLWPQVLALLVLGAAIIFLSAVRFKKRLE
jgi:ABC-2 type transport system permease protein